MRYRWEADSVGESLGQYATEIEPSQIQPGDYVETDRWRMVTAYNRDGLGEIFVTVPNGPAWRHTWVIVDRGAKIRHLSRSFVDATMDERDRVPLGDLPPPPPCVATHACTGLNDCCQAERN